MCKFLMLVVYLPCKSFSLLASVNLHVSGTVPVVMSCFKSDAFQSKHHTELALAKNETSLVHSVNAVAKKSLVCL